MANKVYTVKSGDSLWAIARKNKTTVAALLKANPAIAKRRESGKVDIFSGTKIKLPGTGGKGGSSAGTARSADAARESAMAGRAAQTAARGARARTERNRDAAAASRGQGKNTRSVARAQAAATGRKWYGSAEHRAAQRRGLVGAAAIMTAGVGGGAAAAARGGRAAAAAARPAIAGRGAQKAITSRPNAIPLPSGPIGRASQRMAAQQKSFADAKARLDKAMAAKKAGKPVGTQKELNALRQEVRMERERLAKLRQAARGN